jgi:hypothetical protein
MTATYSIFPPRAAPSWKEPVDTAASLPTPAEDGDVRVALDTGVIYVYDGAAWVTSSGGLSAVSDTNSIDMTNTLGTVSAALNLSSDAADAGFTVVANNIQGGGSPGLRSQVQNSAIRALLSATAPAAYDNTTGVISWSGSLDVVTAQTAGSAAASGKIGEIITGTQATNTATGVAATGVWGNVTSVALSAGEWALSGVAGFLENSAVLTTSLSCGISDSSSGAGIGGFDYGEYPFLVSGTSPLLPTPQVLVNISTPTTYYLNTRLYYTSGSPQHRGRLVARRIR